MKTLSDSTIIDNPLNEEKINITPLLQLMADGQYSKHGCENITIRLQIVHDFLSTHIPTQPLTELKPEAWIEANQLLVELRNTFTAMRMSVSSDAEHLTEG